jgi:trehalose-6-phosphate synthase
MKVSAAEYPKTSLQEEEQHEKEIKSKYGDDSILINRGEFKKETMWALMAVSDIWATTPLRQGYTVVSTFV